MSIAHIHNTLDAKLLTITDLPPLQLENTQVRTGAGIKAFCRSTLLPARPNRETIGINGLDIHSGIYQIDLIYPPIIGYDDCAQMVDLIINTFTTGSVINNIMITNSYSLTGSVNDKTAGLYMVPVIIEYEQFLARLTPYNETI